MRTLSLTLLAGALLATVPLAAQEPPPQPQPDRQRQHGGGMPGGSLFAPRTLLDRRDRLALSDDQVKQLEALAAESRQAREQTQADTRARQEKLRTLWQADQPDVTAIQSEARALMDAQQTARLAALTSAAKAKGLLSAEQRGRVEGWADARRMAWRLDHGPGPGGQPAPGAGHRMRPPMRRF